MGQCLASPPHADAVDRVDLDPDHTALLERLLGKDYEVITADDRLDKLADDFVEHCSHRWQTGKSMLVCIDKITCARMFQRIEGRWQQRLTALQQLIPIREAERDVAPDEDERARLTLDIEELRGRTTWMAGTLIEIIISEAQNEVRDFARWNFDIVPHREVMKLGFETADGKRTPTEDAFKDPQHPFRIAIVCAMWLTGFDVECLTTLYINKPMKAHTLMQAIARANRVYPGKDCGVIVDYNGMLKSLREALAQYALGDDDDGGVGSIVGPIEDCVTSLLNAIEATEQHLIALGFEPVRLAGATGFDRITALRDAVDAVYTSDESKRRFEIMARQVFSRFRALSPEPSALRYAERHDNIEAIYRKEDTFAQLVDLANDLDAEQRRATEEGLTEEELALFDLLFKEPITKKDRERLKQASRSLLSSLQALLQPMPAWVQNPSTQAEVKVFILDRLYESLPRPPFSEDETEALADEVYNYVWQQSMTGHAA